MGILAVAKIKLLCPQSVQSMLCTESLPFIYFIIYLFIYLFLEFSGAVFSIFDQSETEKEWGQEDL